MSSTTARRWTRRSQPARRRIRGSWVPYALIAPFFVALAVFIIGPLVVSLINSLFLTRMIGGTSFVGFTNYIHAFSDGKFWESVARVANYGVIFTPLTIALSLLLALIVDSGLIRGGGVYRTLFFIPYAVPGVVATLMWGFLYGPTISPINDIARALGVGEVNLLSRDAVLLAIGNIGVWAYVGFNLMIFFAALKAIPQDVIEAAVLDGAGPWRIAASVKLPMIKQVVNLVVIFSIIGTAQLLTEPLILQPLQPRSIPDNFSPNMYAYYIAAGGQQQGYVAAISFMLGLVVVALSVTYAKLVNRTGSSVID